MLTLKNKHTTVVLFASGKLHLMGSKITRRHVAYKCFKKVLRNKLKLMHYSPIKVCLQTITAAHDFCEKINLYKLHDYINQYYNYGKGCMPGWMCFYEAELFPALMLKLWGLCVHVNVFASGKCVLTGIKHADEAYIIIEQLCEYLHLYK